jgi:hypothetical protein
MTLVLWAALWVAVVSIMAPGESPRSAEAFKDSSGPREFQEGESRFLLKMKRPAVQSAVVKTAVVLSALLAFATEALGQAATTPRPRRAPERGLKPLASESLDLALERAGQRDEVVLLAVGMAPDGELPALFSSPAVARASRMVLSLASVDYSPDVEFLKSRKITEKDAPCILVLDPRGNIVDRQPERAEPAALVAAARSAKKVLEGIREGLAAAAPLAEDRAAAGDEKGLLEAVRPWLARHYRGYPEIDRFLELVAERGKARMETCRSAPPAEAIEKLGAVARDYADTPVQGEALCEIARLHNEAGRRDEAKKLLQQVVGDLPWPENAASHARANALLRAFRQDDIRRRTEEIDRKAREAAEKK